MSEPLPPVPQPAAAAPAPAPAPAKTRRFAFRALLADGTAYEYDGAHPTHVDTGDGVVRVISTEPIA